MKKIFFLALSSLFVTVPHALAAGSGFVPLAPIPGLTDTSTTAVVNSETLATFLNNLYMYLIGLAAALAVIEIIWGGLEIATKDSVPAQMDGKERIRGAILGLVLVLSPALVFTIINPNILNLSINLPKLDTASGTSSGGPIQPGEQAPCSSSLLIGQSSNTSDSACVTKLQDACRAAGGNPVITGTSVIVVQCNPVQGGPPPGTTITPNQCANLGNVGSVSLQPVVMPASVVQNCAAATGSLSPQAQGYNACADITGGGVCFYTRD